jgi:hypothetical protein
MEISFARLFCQGDFSNLATELPQWHVWQNGLSAKWTWQTGDISLTK